jgi:hypothetical protein
MPPVFKCPLSTLEIERPGRLSRKPTFTTGRIGFVCGPSSEAVGDSARVRRCAPEIESVARARWPVGSLLWLENAALAPTATSSLPASFQDSVFGVGEFSAVSDAGSEI